MGFIILFFIAVFGIGAFLIVLDRKHKTTSPDSPQSHWYDPPMGAYFEQAGSVAQKHAHVVSKTALWYLVTWYRKLRSEIHIFTYLKRKIRAYLYEHDRSGSNGKHISSFLKHVKNSPLEKNEEISYTQETSEKE